MLKTRESTIPKKAEAWVVSPLRRRCRYTTVESKLARLTKFVNASGDVPGARRETTTALLEGIESIRASLSRHSAGKYPVVDAKLDKLLNFVDTSEATPEAARQLLKGIRAAVARLSQELA